MTAERSAVGFIGVGAMGSELSLQALRRGWPVVVFDLDQRRASRLESHGATAVATIGELATRCSWAVTSLPSAAALDAVVAELARQGSRRLRGVVETSTLAVEDKVRAGEVLARGGLAVVDCPLSGTSQQASVGDVVAYVSGSSDDCEAAMPVIRAFSRSQHQLGRIGNGTRMKLVANLLVAIHNVAAAEALLLAERVGLDLPTVLHAVGDGAGSSRMWQVRGPLMVRGEYAATMRVDHFVKDLDLVERLGDELGVPLSLLERCAELYRDMVATGLGTLDTAAVFAELRRRDVALPPPARPTDRHP